MAKSDFEKKVDAAKEASEARKAANRKGDLETMIPIIAIIMGKVQPGIADAEKAIADLDTALPMMTELRQSTQAVQHTLGKAYAAAVAELAELSGETSEEPEAEAAE